MLSENFQPIGFGISEKTPCTEYPAAFASKSFADSPFAFNAYILVGASGRVSGSVHF
jgi:hypothetical protein